VKFDERSLYSVEESDEGRKEDFEDDDEDNLMLTLD